MRDVGAIVRLQIQRSSLKTGEKPHRRYDPAPLLSVERLAVTPDGVLGLSDGGAWLVDVRQGVQVRLKREDVTMRSEPPTTWSVVVRTGVLRPTLGGSNSSDIVMTYAVCPACHERQDFEGKPGTLRCPRCGHTGAVDWSATC